MPLAEHILGLALAGRPLDLLQELGEAVAAHLRSVPSALARLPLGGPPYGLPFPAINICYCVAPGLPPADGFETPYRSKLNTFEREPVHYKDVDGGIAHTKYELVSKNRRCEAFVARPISADETSVTFKWKDYPIEGHRPYKTMTSPTHEFIRRFLIHVLPSCRRPKTCTVADTANCLASRISARSSSPSELGYSPLLALSLIAFIAILGPFHPMISSFLSSSSSVATKNFSSSS
jgi:hypothetical protein